VPVEILTCHGDDAKRWDALIASLPPHAQDVHFTSAYARVQEIAGANPAMLVASNPAGMVISPIDLRFIGQGPHMDVANLYGYGGRYWRLIHGEFAVEARHIEISALNTQCNGWMRSVGVVSEFCAQHPTLYGIGAASEKPEKYVVLMDLRQREEQIYSAMRRAHRRSIRKADEAGVVVSRAEINPDNMLLMATLYRTSMARLGAAQRWQFPTSYFDAHANELGEDGCSLYLAGLPGGVDRTLLVVHHGDVAYAHFLGSTGENLRIGIDENLYYRVALDLKMRGFKTFHLGGGAISSPDDSLFQFKSGFSDWLVPVFRTFRVLDSAAYDLLCFEKKMAEIAKHGRESISTFQPIYRREFL